MTERRRYRFVALAGDRLRVGAASGALAGLAMLVFILVRSAVVDRPFWFPLKEFGATFVGPESLVAGGGAVLWGLVLHFAVAVFFGVLYALLLPRDTSMAESAAGGVVYGLAILLLMTFLVLPVANPTLRARVALMPWTWLIQHALYGLVLGALVPLLRAGAGSLFAAYSRLTARKPRA